MRVFLLSVVLLVAGTSTFSLQGIPKFSDVKDANQTILCDVCEFVGDEINKRILTPDTKKQVIKIAKVVCDKLPIFGKECNTAVDYYASDLMDKLFAMFDYEALCVKARVCQSKNVLIPSFFGVQETESCKACMDGLGIVKMVLDSDELEDLLDIAVTEMCMGTGASEKTCADLSKTIVNQIAHNLRPMFSPDVICKSAGACEGSLLDAVHLTSDTGCTVCKDGFRIIKKLLTSPEVSEIIDVAVNETCLAMGFGAETCEALVGSICHDILNNLMLSFEPDFICGQIGACAANKAAVFTALSADSDGCVACVDALNVVQQVLTSPALLDLFQIAVSETCSAIGGNSDLCESIVNGILDPIVLNLVTLFKPRELCTLSGTCAAHLNAVPDKMACLACHDSLTIVKMILESEELSELIHMGINTTCGEGAVGRQCRMIFSVIVDNTRHQLLPKFLPRDICTAAGSCPALPMNSALALPPAYCCDFCVNAVDEFKNILADAETGAMLADVTEGLCDTIKTPLCKPIINAVTKELLVQAGQIDTNSTCSGMGAC